MDSRPKAQPSRKGKKAWRKNVDVDDIHKALEAKREKEVLHGDEEDEFVIDTDGDASTTKVQTLKTHEILSNKSRVPAILSKKVKHKVSKAHAKKLMALAGKLLTESKLKARVDRDGIIRAANIDVWGDGPELEQPEVYKRTAFRAYTPASKPPSTLAHQPIALHGTATDGLVHAGKSYNPSLESWKSLIDTEFSSEQDLEVKRQAMEEHQRRIQHLIETLDGRDIESSDEETEQNQEEEQEPEEEEDEEDKYKLSLNKRTELKIKTKTRRNREARHKEREELYVKLKEIKKQIHDLARLEDIEQEVAGKTPKARPAKKYARHGKHDITFKPIEVKLSDELTNNLRSVKPEGNLFYEHMHKLQASGRVEARIPVARKRRYARKFTEKWSYKNFK